MITTIGVMIVTSLSVAREREQRHSGSAAGLSAHHTADFRWVKRCLPGADCRDLRSHDRAGYRHWAYQIPFADFVSAVLFHDGDLRAVAGRLWLADIALAPRSNGRLSASLSL